ncbi:amidinotransferase [Sphingobacterium psychroaquaticum]|uniref:citrulline utilization hydrolase CtlX n=1 Tax=Sphingobacterium psychroaquaticum TaxID=561061 RepID=UPI00106C150B|nr:arginine deiminase-related protein [Sphingobacterium psychroaquaticum]QBQ39751.1 amidinotransferase [Sphingobacterium psychroaquaticum]
MTQTTDTLLLVRPFAFRKNEQTAVNNYFQTDISVAAPTSSAQKEFDAFVEQLNLAGIKTLVIQDTGTWDTPDSVFPNNCISLHQGTAVLYPMFAENRRLERKLDYISFLRNNGYEINQLIDYIHYENENIFLEGTGCLILDRVQQIAYCSMSDRADELPIRNFCADLSYTPCIFQANQSVNGSRLPIYHTNVMLSVGTHYAVICLSSIDNLAQREEVIAQLKRTNKEIIDISEEQMYNFAGNILEVKSTDGEPRIVMSSAAYNSFTPAQLDILSRYGQIVHAPLDTIETCGGGSARCMLAEVFY